MSLIALYSSRDLYYNYYLIVFDPPWLGSMSSWRDRDERKRARDDYDVPDGKRERERRANTHMHLSSLHY